MQFTKDTNYRIALNLLNAYHLDKTRDAYIFKKCEAHYLKYLAIYPEDKEANYGLGSLYYNEAVYYLKMSKTSDSIQSKQFLNQSIDYMNLANPYLQKYKTLVESSKKKSVEKRKED